MVLHRQQAQFGRAKWRMSILLPCWVLQISLLLATIGLFSWRLAHSVREYEEDKRKGGNVRATELVWEITNLGLPLIILILTLIEFVKLGAETLTPWTMVATNVVKTVCACGGMSVDVVMYIQRKDRHYSLVGLVMDSILIVAILIPTIYSIMTYRRLASFDDYHYPVNIKAYGYNDQENQQRTASKSGRLSIASLSESSLRRFSGSSSYNPAAVYQSQPEAPASLTSIGRAGSSYNNERDTHSHGLVAVPELDEYDEEEHHAQTQHEHHRRQSHRQSGDKVALLGHHRQRSSSDPQWPRQRPPVPTIEFEGLSSTERR
ncbi:NAD-dependent deacetylase hst4 [Verticillium dahliae VDG1]|nr:NAD-dependent deacetylase hst4 [Verticillium dahliae VDG1]